MSANAASLSNAIDLFAVNAGIAPSLTSAQTPSPLHSPATEYPMPALVSTSSTAPATRSSSVSRSRTSIGGGGEDETTMRDASLSRRSDASSSSGGGPGSAHAPPASSGTAAHAVKAALLNAAGPSVNLVARDAVQAAHLIPTIASPAADSVTNAELVVLGVPTVGAKSRVETQIKISLALVRPRAGGGGGGGGGGAARVSDDMVMVDGGLDARAADDLERLGTWSHLRLPKNLALKSKPGKQLSAAALAKKAKPGASLASRSLSSHGGRATC